MLKPLSDVKVLDLTHHIAGPYSTKLLADYGAEVLKVERPGGGDPARGMAPFLDDIPGLDRSGLFLFLNTNKRSITLNLKSATGVKILKELVKEADILVENFSPRVMPSFGLDYQTIEALNPSLVMTSISSFGQTGPYRDFQAADITEVAMGGWMSVIGDPAREPLKPGGNQAQFVAGLMAGIATMTAFHGRDAVGGQHIDLSIMDAVVYIQMNTTQEYAYHQRVRKRLGNIAPPVPSWILPCRDGYIGTVAVTTSQWRALCEWTGIPELIEIARSNGSALARSQHADEIQALLRPWLMEHDQEELLREAQRRRIPFGIPSSSQRLLASEHLNQRGYFVEVDHPETGKLRYPGAQVKIGDLPYELQPAPLLGEHNSEIIVDRLGYSRQDLVRLRQQGII